MLLVVTEPNWLVPTQLYRPLSTLETDSKCTLPSTVTYTETVLLIGALSLNQVKIGKGSPVMGHLIVNGWSAIIKMSSAVSAMVYGAEGGTGKGNRHMATV